MTIVEIDEAALAAHGQWPWPRTRVAELVERIACRRAGRDRPRLLFPEPDRFSPAALAALLPQLPADVSARLRKLPGNDDLLARTLRGRPVVLALAGLEETPPTSDPPVLHFAARLASIGELDAGGGRPAG